MIFYFSGTGNSLSAARTLSSDCNDVLRSIPLEMMRGKADSDYVLEDGEAIGFVYPVYAWAPPKMVMEFIHKLSFANYSDHFIYSIATCGDNIGNSMKVLEKALKKKGLTLHSGFSLIMPNNYILLGDIDSKAVEEKKLREADEAMRPITQVVRDRQSGIFEMKKGPVPEFFTGLINPLFNKYALDAGKFYATDGCTSCGRCEEVCLTDNIKVSGKPSWGGNCTQCLACIHSCPERAIQYGNITINKGRYLNPVLKK